MKTKIFEHVNGNCFKLITESGNQDSFNKGQANYDAKVPVDDENEEGIDWASISAGLEKQGWVMFKDPKHPNKQLYKNKQRPEFGIDIYENSGNLVAYLWNDSGNYNLKEVNFGNVKEINESQIGIAIGDYFNKQIR